MLQGRTTALLPAASALPSRPDWATPLQTRAPTWDLHAISVTWRYGTLKHFTQSVQIYPKCSIKKNTICITSHKVLQLRQDIRSFYFVLFFSMNIINPLTHLKHIFSICVKGAPVNDKKFNKLVLDTSFFLP